MITKYLDPKNDVCFKRVFGTEKNKNIVIHFINDVMDFKSGDVIEDLQFLSPELAPDIASKKQSLVDVLCQTADGSKIIIEMQVARTRGFEKRAQFYASKAYSSQLNKGQEEDGLYENLKQVIFIAITDYEMFPKKKRYVSRHKIFDIESYENDLKDFSFTFIELPKFKKEEIGELKTMLEKWCYFFKKAKISSPEDIEKIVGSDQVLKQAYDEVSSFNWSEKEMESYEAALKIMRDNKAAYDQVMFEGIEKGKKEGKAEGLKEGEEKGKIEGKIEGLKEGEEKAMHKVIKIMSKNAQSLENIKQNTNLSIEQIKKILG